MWQQGLQKHDELNKSRTKMNIFSWFLKIVTSWFNQFFVRNPSKEWIFVLLGSGMDACVIGVIGQGCKLCTLWHCTRTSPRHFLLSQCHIVLQYVHKCSFIYTNRKVCPFLSWFSWNLNQQHNLHNCCTLFHPNWTIIVESWDINSFLWAFLVPNLIQFRRRI